MTAEVKLTPRTILESACEGARITMGVGPALFKYAQACDSVDVFLAGCEDAEIYVRAPNHENPWEADKLPRSWTQAKSNIAASMRAGLSPLNFKNEYEMRNAKSTVNAAKNGLPTETPAKEPKTEPEPQGTVIQPVELAAIPLIPDDMTRLISELARLPELSRAKEIRFLTNHAKQCADNASKADRKGKEALKQQAATA